MTTPTPATTPTLGTPVRGDGTTARTRAGRRWRAVRWTVGVGAVVVLAGIILGLLRSPTSGTPYAPDNPSAAGGQALAHVLADHGVHVTYTRSVAAAVRQASPGQTLAVWPGTGDEPSARDLRELASTRADLALLGPDDALVAAAAPELTPSFAWGAGDAEVAQPGCDDPDARAAGSVTTSGSGFSASHRGAGDVTLCFPTHGARGRTGSYAVVTRAGDAGGAQSAPRVAALDDPGLATNRSLALQGNAALAVRMLGRHAELVWLVPDDLAASTSDDDSATIADLVPPWFRWVGLWGVVVVLLAIWWRGRRLGPLVAENLPVVVRSSETTRGRGRLYRAGGSRGHAAAGLRAAAVDRTAHALGLPRSATPEAVVRAVARASGWDATLVAEILYGPPPPDDAGLLRLARLVDDLENEVRP